MILYQEDWVRFPYVIVDYKTSNKSFLELAKTLAALGIRNNLFFLALHDSSLQGVDPFSPNLTLDQMRRIHIECSVNPWYYIREICRIPGGGADGIRLKANRAIISQYWTRLQNIDLYTIQPRQTGKSIFMLTSTVWGVHFGYYSVNQIVITKDRDLIYQNTKDMKEIRNLLPPYLIKKSRKDKDVEGFFNYTELKNTVTFIPSQNDAISAEKAGRGFTTTILNVDEIAYVKYIQNMLPAAIGSMRAAVGVAKSLGAPYGRYYSTTAGDLTLPHGKYAYDMFTGGCTWTEDFFDLKDQEELQKIIFQNTGNPVPRISMQYSHLMLGITDQELRETYMAAQATEEEINKDYFLKWSRGGVGSIIPQVILDAINAGAKQPIYNQLTEAGYIMKWYIKKEDIESYMANNDIVMGIDTSEQINRDSTAFVLVNIRNLEIVATMSVADANIITTANFFANFLVKYRKVTAIIEKKSSAQTFIDTAIITMRTAGINPFQRFFNHVINDKTVLPEEYKILKRNGRLDANEYRRHFGFNTSGSSRTFLYSKILDDATSRSRHVIYDDNLASQLSGLKIDANGKIDHKSGGHDDMVIAWLLVHWFLQFGRNLDYYGIDFRQVMKDVTKDGTIIDGQDDGLQSYLEELQAQAEKISAEIKRNPHPVFVERHTVELKRINAVLEQHGVDTLTIESIVKDSSELNARHVRNNRIRR